MADINYLKWYRQKMSWETGIPTKTTSSSTGKPDRTTFPSGSTALQVKPQSD
jgi:hypothetical protein